MSATATFRPTLQPGFSSSRAFGLDAQTVKTLVCDVRESMLASYSIGAPTRKTFSNLTDTFLDCFYADWDGYDAHPVTPQTFENAKRFLQSMVGVWPQPTVAAEPDGEISFEWYRGPRLRLSVSIGPDSTIAFAGMFGSNTVHGTETFTDEIPTAIAQQLWRLYRMPM